MLCAHLEIALSSERKPQRKDASTLLQFKSPPLNGSILSLSRLPPPSLLGFQSVQYEDQLLPAERNPSPNPELVSEAASTVLEGEPRSEPHAIRSQFGPVPIEALGAEKQESPPSEAAVFEP